MAKLILSLIICLTLFKSSRATPTLISTPNNKLSRICPPSKGVGGCFANINKDDKDTIPPAPCVRINKQYIKSYFTDTRDIFLAPTKFKTKDWLIVLGTTLVGAGIATQDHQIAHFAQTHKSKESVFFSQNVAQHFGDGLYSAPILLSFYIHGKTTGNCKSKTVALKGVEAFILSGALIQIPKYAFQRHRPYTTSTLNPYLFDGPFGKYKNNSFPSGHTIAAFSVANIIARQYKDKKWVGILCYSLASLTAVSRVHDNKHWSSDIFFGAALGIGISNVIFNNIK